MHSSSNNVGPSYSANTRVENVSGDTYNLYSSGDAQRDASREAPVSTDLYPTQVPIPSNAWPQPSCGNEVFYSGSLSPAAFHEQGHVEDGQDHSVAQSSWSSVQHAVAVFESTQALSRLLSDVILGKNVESPASEVLDVAEHELECWGAAASSDLAESLKSIYASTRRPFDGPVGPDTWLDERNNALFRTRPDEEFETFAFPPPSSNPISQGPRVRRRRHLARSTVDSPDASSSPCALGLTSGPSHTEHAVAPAVVLLPQSSHSSNKRTPTSDMDWDLEVAHTHKKTRTDAGEVLVRKTEATQMEAHEGDTERLPSVDDEFTRAMSVAAQHPGTVVASSSNATLGPESVETGEFDVQAIEDVEAYPEALEEADDDQTPGSVPVPAHPPAPALAPVPAPVLAPAPRPKRARRTNAEIATTLVPGLMASTCGFPNCGFLHRPTSGDNNRDHIKEKHYTLALLSSRNQLVCGWGNCGLPFSGTQMMAHIERDHIGYGYLCPIFGENCPDHWRGSRAKDQTTHARRDH